MYGKTCRKLYEDTNIKAQTKKSILRFRLLAFSMPTVPVFSIYFNSKYKDNGKGDESRNRPNHTKELFYHGYHNDCDKE